MRIKAEREFANVTGADVGIENIVQFLGLVARRLNNLSVLEFQPDMVKTCALINCRRVKGDKAVDRVAHRSRKNFAARNVPVATADDGWNFFNAKSQIRSRACDFYSVGSLHQFFKRVHSRLKLAVIERANFEEKIFEGFGAHTGELGHGWGRPSQHYPLRFLNAPILDWPHFFCVQTVSASW